MYIRAGVEALVFLRDYLRAGDWWTAHTWSLSIEEQFYLLWQACLVLAGIAKSRRLAVALILGAPIIRVTSHLLFPNMGWQEQLMLHMQIDGLMISCSLALFYEKVPPSWK
jgi:peptidoglycan/LPS O-acetylase OafA/YrhL